MTMAPTPPRRPAPARGVALWVTLATGLIASSEGLRQTAYRDPIGIPTACYGETRNISLGMKFTLEECNTMLGGRLVEFDRGIANCIENWDNYAAGVRASSVSLAYNIGTGAFCKSTAARLFREGKIEEGCHAFLKFNKAKGVVFPGLTARRQREEKVCLGGEA